MRVISGSARGTKLFTPKDEKVRPTTDRIKESIFNIIQPINSDSLALDLFSGTGSIGIEFISRGSKCAYFVDNDSDSIELINKNIKKCRMEEKSRILKMDYKRALENFSDTLQKFDYIFIDPPYNKLEIETIIEAIYDNKILAEEGLIVIEIPKEYEIRINSKNHIVLKEKIYGITKIVVMKEVLK
jgi:16S rRNA (guanine(966)-N(2))-methyltransferase RsmD